MYFKVLITMFFTICCVNLIKTVSGSLKAVILIHYFEEGWLILKCKIDSPQLSIFIHDIHNIEQGHCRPIPVPTCYNYFPKDSELSFDSNTNITTYMKKASNSKDIKGEWKCSHGSGSDNPTSTIEVDFEENSNQDTFTALCIVTFAISFGFGLKDKLSVLLRIVFGRITGRKKADTKQWICLRRNKDCIERILNRTIKCITKCGMQSVNRKFVLFRGMKIIIFVAFGSIPYSAIAVINYYNSSLTKDTWIIIDVTLLVMGYSIGIICAKVADAERGQHEEHFPKLEEEDILNADVDNAEKISDDEEECLDKNHEPSDILEENNEEDNSATKHASQNMAKDSEIFDNIEGNKDENNIAGQ